MIEVGGTVVKRFFIPIGLLFASGLLGTASYAVRELIVVFVFFSVGFVALLLITIICFLLRDTAIGLRRRVPLWNRVRRDWVVEFSYSLNEISKQARTVQWRHLWERLTHRIPNPAVRQPIPTEIDQES